MPATSQGAPSQRPSKLPNKLPSDRMAQRLRSIPPTIFSQMSALAVRTGSINLGQGFPDQDGPSSVVDAAVAALRSGRNQYAPGPGVPELREAVARTRPVTTGSTWTR